jgi:hypothetical protein
VQVLVCASHTPIEEQSPPKESFFIFTVAANTVGEKLRIQNNIKKDKQKT